MGAQLRVFAGGSAPSQATKKITKAMELIAASRIVKAQSRVAASRPYATELTRALDRAASNAASIDSTRCSPAQKQPARAAVLRRHRATAAWPAATRPTRSREAQSADRPARRTRARRSSPTSSAARASRYYRFRDRDDRASRGPASPSSPTYADATRDRRRR